MCECFNIGGSFISEDPDCEVHGSGGYIAQIDELNDKLAKVEAELDAMKAAAKPIAEWYKQWGYALIEEKREMFNTLACLCTEKQNENL